MPTALYCEHCDQPIHAAPERLAPPPIYLAAGETATRRDGSLFTARATGYWRIEDALVHARSLNVRCADGKHDAEAK